MPVDCGPPTSASTSAIGIGALPELAEISIGDVGIRTLDIFDHRVPSPHDGHRPAHWG